MGFQQGLSGLNGAAKNLDVIGNNIANVSTVGFKSSRTEFADVYASSLTGTGGLQVGIGTQIVNVAQQFTQGNITITNSPLDVAINGDGFYRLNDNGAIVFSRNGQFHLDDAGYIVNNNGLRLTGYQTDANGNLVSANPDDLQISFADIPPSETDELSMVANLDSRVAAPAGAFDPTDSATYNHATAVTVYDERGNAHALNLYFRKVDANNWDVYGTLINAAGNHIQLDGGALLPSDPALGRLTFDSAGTLTGSTVGAIAIAVAATNTGAGAMSVTPSFAGTTLFGNTFGVNSLFQNGYASGRIVGLNVSDNGMLQGRYTNGESRVMGQIVLGSFNNPGGLQSLGGNLWSETGESGPPNVGSPGSGVLGVLQSGSVEDSNVDLTSELVNLIIAQRLYQANAQTIRAQDQILQTLINLR